MNKKHAACPNCGSTELKVNKKGIIVCERCGSYVEVEDRDLYDRLYDDYYEELDRKDQEKEAKRLVELQKKEDQIRTRKVLFWMLGGIFAAIILSLIIAAIVNNATNKRNVIEGQYQVSDAIVVIDNKSNYSVPQGIQDYYRFNFSCTITCKGIHPITTIYGCMVVKDRYGKVLTSANCEFYTYIGTTRQIFPQNTPYRQSLSINVYDLDAGAEIFSKNSNELDITFKITRIIYNDKKDKTFN